MKSSVPFVAALAGAAGLGGCGVETAHPPAEVGDVWVRLPVLAGRPAAGYFRVETNGPGETLVSASSPQAGRIEFHRSVTERGRSTMQRLGEISIEPGRPIVAEPGSAHLMLFGLDPALRAGDTISLTFRFRLASPVTAQARLVAAGDATPGHDED